LPVDFLLCRFGLGAGGSGDSGRGSSHSGSRY
jgi:hypothetical protein